MPTLVLLRHAAAERKGMKEDRDRLLTDDGREEAARMAAHLAERFRPELVVASTAPRAHETAQIALKAWTPAPKLVGDARLYLATAKDLMGYVKSVPERIACLMLVGHDPAFSDLATQLAGREIQVEKAGAAVFSFPAWKDADRSAKLLFHEAADTVGAGA